MLPGASLDNKYGTATRFMIASRGKCTYYRTFRGMAESKRGFSVSDIAGPFGEAITVNCRLGQQHLGPSQPRSSLWTVQYSTSAFPRPMAGLDWTALRCVRAEVELTGYWGGMNDDAIAASRDAEKRLHVTFGDNSSMEYAVQCRAGQSRTEQNSAVEQNVGGSSREKGPLNGVSGCF
ncbi:hypothetical protein FGSG_12196 [Fusarium graminearum PH-1]|uniref:Chromosome 1, complete genome n=1 Tax=Gibberella zeae (strain ATCC MYA-4620 / CBS 123657 / FGSC 9075 / NRRL 31084 / PH-1) TaxID=229533 RepID=I1S5S5_GIBZE|nr:hypothetical protein FGSG_12196 [Fusarium graminearum PH-1]ESU08223.1 hypothetical protein FGSG_12196 [Fusarium graminearum PH-1]CEF75100.1 unnamed protein product [Fusarium graminearum]|eukprot:XP_011318708.1 hypothetical protein FGSG_12196 [Fusarium graminearum PH-1]